MGNNATREAPPPGSSPTGAMHRRPASLIPGGSETNPSGSRTFYRETGSDSRREGGRSRSDFPIIGIGGSSSMGAEPRRETKQEREARRAERDRIARERERERSMREESVDGGYLVTLGVYTGPEDFSRPIVRQLMIERRLAPFWKGLNDHSDSWTEYQLVAAARGLPIPAADEIPPEDLVRPPSKHHQEQAVPEQNISHLTIPISSRSQSYNSDASPSLSPSHPAFSNSGSLPTSPGHSSFPLRSRSKTLASLSSGSNSQQPDMSPQEVELPKDSFVDGLPLEAYLYRNASECPICFLYYPPYLNQTRCCDQSICSECFVQIKRPDPHPPEYHDQSPPSAEVQAQRAADPEGQLVCEPAACPFCVQPEFGVTYTPPQFRRGLAYANQSSSHPLSSPGSAMSSSASLHSGASSPTTPARRRATSLAANAPSVITTDKIRPDWASKLASARAHAARRSAAATALHTAAYLMGSMGNGDGRSFAGFGRRNRRESPVGTSGAPRDPFSGMHPVHRSYLSAMAGSNPNGSNRIDGNGPGSTYPDGSAEPSRQQSRMEDLDDMMMAEAIRLSLVAEEERKKKEEKEAKKEAKKKEKEEKKAQKAARKGSYQSSNNNSSSALVGDGAQTNTTLTNDGKGKGIDRVEGPLASAHQGGNVESSATSLGLPHLAPSEPLSWNFPTSEEHQTRGGSHLRKVSNVSSSESSFVDNSPSPMDHATSGVDASKSSKESTSRAADGGSDGEPLFNFRSLASMIGEDEKTTEATHAEHSHYHRGESTSPKQQYSIGPQDQGQGIKHGHNELSSASTANP